MVQVSLDDIESTTHRALTGHGADGAVANHVAHAVRVAEATGNKICGLYYLESYCNQLESGRIDGKAKPVVTHDRPGAVQSGRKARLRPSRIRCRFRHAKAAARANGICGYSVEHTHTCTSVGLLHRTVRQGGLLAIGDTNATPRVAPPGRSVPVLGTNPIAMAVPDGKRWRGVPVRLQHQRGRAWQDHHGQGGGREDPLGWAVDADGEPTTDPEAALLARLSPPAGTRGTASGSWWNYWPAP